MKSLIATVLLMIATNANAQNWITFPHKTKAGAVYAAVCKACIGGSYNNDNSGYWACTDAPEGANRACLESIIDALQNRGEYGGQ